MRRALIALLVLSALVVVGDLAARRAAENELEDRARAEARGPGSVDARIRSFPFLGRLLFDSSVSEVDVQLVDVRAGPLDLAVLDMDLEGVRLDRDKLLSGKAEMEDIDRGTISVDLDAAAIQDAINLPVSISGDRITVRHRGVTVSARAETAPDGGLVLRVGRLPPFIVPLARTRLLSCAAARAAVVGGRVRLSCDITEVPPALRG